MSLLGATGLAIMLAIVLYLARALAGPTIFDRILALNALGTKVVLLVVVLSVVSGRTDQFDIALVYALLNFVGTLAVLRLVQARRGA